MNTQPKPLTLPPKSATGRGLSYRDLLNRERGLVPLELETDLLLTRIAQGGHAGQFLADAFFSAYRTKLHFNHSLGELIHMDGEAFRLFHQILHIRYAPMWSDENLFKIEQQIKDLLKSPPALHLSGSN